MQRFFAYTVIGAAAARVVIVVAVDVVVVIGIFREDPLVVALCLSCIVHWLSKTNGADAKKLATF